MNPNSNAAPNADRISRFVENGLDSKDIASPMDPPQAFEIPEAARQSVAYENLAKPLQRLFDDHVEFIRVLEGFEKSLVAFRESQWQMNPDISKAFRDFFYFMDNQTPAHNAKEEKALFPLLRERLISAGECSPVINTTTPTDVMEDEHQQVFQSASLVFNLLGIGAKLPDEKSRGIVFQHAVDAGREICDIMKLHIFRENEVLLPLAQKLISAEEFAVIDQKMQGL